MGSACVSSRPSFEMNSYGYLHGSACWPLNSHTIVYSHYHTTNCLNTNLRIIAYRLHIAVYCPCTNQYWIIGIQWGQIIQAKGMNQPGGKQTTRRTSQRANCPKWGANKPKGEWASGEQARRQISQGAKEPESKKTKRRNRKGAKKPDT